MAHKPHVVSWKSIFCSHSRLSERLPNGLYRCLICRSLICTHWKTSGLREDDTIECLLCGTTFTADG